MIHSNHLQTRNAMTVCNLSKKFGSFDAVRGLTFGVRDKVNSTVDFHSIFVDL